MGTPPCQERLQGMPGLVVGACLGGVGVAEAVAQHHKVEDCHAHCSPRQSAHQAQQPLANAAAGGRFKKHHHQRHLQAGMAGGLACCGNMADSGSRTMQSSISWLGCLALTAQIGRPLSAS